MNNNEHLYSIVTSLVAKHTHKDVVTISCKLISDSKSIAVSLLYKKNTQLNPFNDDIFFAITFPETFPHKPPVVNVLSNFSVPTFYDNRNYLCSIINHYWSPKSEQHAVSIEEIITKIPPFLENINDNNRNKILIYYGDYNIDEVYEMNDFLINSDNAFYRVIHVAKKQMHRYIVLTGIHLLLFDPCADMKHLAKLIYVGKLMSVSKRVHSQVKHEDTLIIEFNEGESATKMKFVFEPGNTGDSFISDMDRRVKRIKDRYEIFTDDDIKQGDSSSSLFKKKNTKDVIESTKALIQYKERLYKQKKTNNLMNELSNLYQKMVDVLSGEENGAHEEYVEKIKQLYNDQERGEVWSWFNSDNSDNSNIWIL